jgi:septum formation inhibitor-activating ATPase MinD
MTEGNFVDYVKIFVSSGKGGKGSTFAQRNLLKKGVQMVAMVAVVDTFILWVIRTLDLVSSQVCSSH